MTGDCHVRFCERLRGETPLCLLGAITPFLKNRLTGYLQSELFHF
jgi:hypothetical protein